MDFSLFDQIEREILIDSGTSFVVLPPSVISTLEKKLTHIQYLKVDQEILWPCGEEDLIRYPNVTYYTRGVVFNLTARSYLYLSSARQIVKKIAFFFSNVTIERKNSLSYCNLIN